MKITFCAGFVIGFAGVLAASHLYPWVAHARLPSQTSVITNGGRAEQFVIRLPVDRVGTAGTPATGLRSSPVFANMALPAELAEKPILIEHFKIRDSANNVIGLAARHWSVTSGGPETAWVLMIPSRGALVLGAPGEPASAVDEALRRAGYKPGAAWEGDVRVGVGEDEDARRVVVGTEEFATLDGRYSETWHLTGVDTSGELRGTIEIDTVTFRGS
jgi:hypothetical protein